jgi:hypothetical protein
MVSTHTGSSLASAAALGASLPIRSFSVVTASSDEPDIVSSTGCPVTEIERQIASAPSGHLRIARLTT